MTLKAVTSCTIKVGFNPLKNPFPVSLFRICLRADAAKNQVKSAACRHFIAIIFKDDSLRWAVV